MARNRKAEIITFKADESLLEAMRGVANRSEFIRQAILSALQSVCPLCGGSGVLTPNQRNHWEQFTKDHSMVECEDCHEVRLVCQREDDDPPDDRQPRTASGG